MSRGVLYIVWGEHQEPYLGRSMTSLAKYHPEIPTKVVRLGADATLLDKARMFDLSPFDETLFLDADTIVMGSLGFGFEQALRHALACCICECPWARRYTGMLPNDFVEYNTGVLFFTRAAKPVFDAWKSAAATLDSSIRFHGGDGQIKTMPRNDQGGFAAAIASLAFNPYVLPLNWNLRPIWQRSFFGPIKIWHDYDNPTIALLDWNQQQETGVIRYARLP